MLEVVLEVVEVLVVDVADDDVLEVVDALEELELVLVVDTVLDVGGRVVEEVLIELVAELLTAGETPSVRYAPTPTITTTTTTTAARAVVLTASRRLENFEYDI